MKVNVKGINTISTFDHSVINKAIHVLSESMATIPAFDYSTINKAIHVLSENMETIPAYDYSAIYKAINVLSSKVKDISTYGYSAVNKAIQTLSEKMKGISTLDASVIIWARDLAKNLTDFELCEKPNLECLNDIELAQLSLELSSAVSDKENWQQKVASVSISWKNKNPVYAWLLNYVILGVILSLLSSYTYSALTNKKTTIREEPKANAAVVYNIKTNQTVQVIESVAYYYKVEIHQESSEEPITGWVSKRSLTTIHNKLATNEGTE